MLNVHRVIHESSFTADHDKGVITHEIWVKEDVVVFRSNSMNKVLSFLAKELDVEQSRIVLQPQDSDEYEYGDDEKRQLDSGKLMYISVYDISVYELEDNSVWGSTFNNTPYEIEITL